ncbi:MAG TPA: biotin--[acetyl-CoA-carboxylase] ligase [Acetobacteraceae bacterium]|nr:biotin--[acetyl-CoA-carboxylase] ligase [Acetobacteraceae bacterium]
MTAAALPPGWRLRIHEALPSTSDLLVRLAAAGESEGLAVMARRQSAGRGRDGRVWESPAGNLYISVLLRPGGPAREAPQWALLAAVALAEALSGFVPDPSALRLKWPNDLLLGGAKCAGVLAEASATPEGRTEWLVLGMGANLVVAPEVPGRHTAALGIARPAEEVAAALLIALARWRRARLLEGFAPIRTAWVARGPELGDHIVIQRPAGPVAGRYAGLAEDGALLLSTGSRVHAMTTGEIQG